MRRLLLLRHAKSDWAVGGQRDIDRVLAERGRTAAPVMGHYLARHALRPDKIVVSSARRARETCDLIVPAFDRPPPVAVEARVYEAPAKALLEVVRETPPEVHTLLMIGHNPGIQELASLLMATGDIHARQSLLEKFPTAALAVLDFPVDHWSEVQPHTGRLDRFITPRALSAETE
ncbi:MAG: histidine phosphatase family protein [Variibacter sp.]|nr:histidine phosphatase family protein [Variibacter sp.]